MKAQWDWGAGEFTRTGTQRPEFGPVLSALAERCEPDFRIVFTGDGKRCLLAYRQTRDDEGLVRTLEALAEAGNLQFRRVDDPVGLNWPEPEHVLQLAEPELGVEIPKILQELTYSCAVAFHSRGGRMLGLFVGNGDGTVSQAEAFRARRVFDNGSVFWPGPFGPRKQLLGGVAFDDLVAGFYLDQFEPEISPVSVQVGESETGSPVFVDAGAGHILILGPANSTVGRRVGNQLALKAVQAGQIVVVVQPQVENLGVLAQANPKIISTRMDERSIATWQSQVLVGPGLSVIQGHPGGDALEQLQQILQGLWVAAQVESRREDWPEMTVVINDFVPTASEPRSDATDRRTLPPYRHQLYELLAQMAGSFNAIRLVLLGRPSVVFGVEHLRAVIGSFGQIVRLRTVAEGYARGEGYSHDRFEDQAIQEWHHSEGTPDRCLILGPEGWTKTKLGLVEPEVEVAVEPTIQVLRPDEVQQTHRWEPRQRPTIQSATSPQAPTGPVPTEGELERLLKATGILPLTPKEKEAFKALKAEEAEDQTTAEAETKAEEPVCRTKLSGKQERTLRNILDLVDRLVEGHGFDPQDLRRLVRSGVSRERFECFLAGEISREELEAPAARAQKKLVERVRDLKEDHEGLAQVLPAAALA